MNNTMRLAAALLLTGSAAHAATLDLGQVQLSYTGSAFTSQGMTDVDAAYLAQARPSGYFGPLVYPLQAHTPTVSAANTVELSPSFEWTYYAPDLAGYLTDDLVPGIGSATLRGQNLLLQADSGWAIKSITWIVEGHMTSGYQASASVQGGDMSSSAALPGSSQLLSSYSETPLVPAAPLYADRTFVHQTSLTFSQALQQVTLDEVRFDFVASGYSRVECRDPVFFEQVSCNEPTYLWSHTDYGSVSAAATSARLSIEVTAIPEPSSLALGLAAIGWLAGRRLRSQA